MNDPNNLANLMRRPKVESHGHLFTFFTRGKRATASSACALVLLRMGLGR